MNKGDNRYIRIEDSNFKRNPHKKRRISGRSAQHKKWVLALTIFAIALVLLSFNILISLGMIGISITAFFLNKWRRPKLHELMFDDFSLFVLNRKLPFKIKLENIIRLDETIHEIDELHFIWKIDYLGMAGHEKTLYFLPTWNDDDYTEFKQLIKQHNSSAQV